MPDPKGVFTAFKADLEAVGITVNETSKPWNGGYLDGVEAQQAGPVPARLDRRLQHAGQLHRHVLHPHRQPVQHRDPPWGAQLSSDLKAADADPGCHPAQRGVRSVVIWRFALLSPTAIVTSLGALWAIRRLKSRRENGPPGGRISP